MMGGGEAEAKKALSAKAGNVRMPARVTVTG